jgi:hypothetical protein
MRSATGVIGYQETRTGMIYYLHYVTSCDTRPKNRRHVDSCDLASGRRLCKKCQVCACKHEEVIKNVVEWMGKMVISK